MQRRALLWAVGLVAGLSGPLHGDDVPPDPVGAFVTANIVATFYHEVGHALIAARGVRIDRSEEDAADALSVVLIDRLHDEAAAQAMIRQVARAYGVREIPAAVLVSPDGKILRRRAFALDFLPAK